MGKQLLRCALIWGAFVLVGGCVTLRTNINTPMVVSTPETQIVPSNAALVTSEQTMLYQIVYAKPRVFDPDNLRQGYAVCWPGGAGDFYPQPDDHYRDGYRKMRRTISQLFLDTREVISCTAFTWLEEMRCPNELKPSITSVNGQPRVFICRSPYSAEFINKTP